jgi:hypothetical protein
VLPDCLILADLECLVESAIGGFNAEIRVQNEQGIGNGIDDALRPDVTIPDNAVKVFQVHEAVSRRILIHLYTIGSQRHA